MNLRDLTKITKYVIPEKVVDTTKSTYRIHQLKSTASSFSFCFFSLRISHYSLI